MPGKKGTVGAGYEVLRSDLRFVRPRSPELRPAVVASVDGDGVYDAGPFQMGRRVIASSRHHR